jgi:hypothetical protein
LKCAILINHMALMALVSTSVHLFFIESASLVTVVASASTRQVQRLWLSISSPGHHARSVGFYFMLSPHRFCGESLPLFSSAAPLP